MPIPELLIDDVIGGSWWYEGITSRYVNRWLKQYGDEKEILVRVNSPGGSVFEGHAIYGALNRCKANVVMEVEGMAASAASVILMAGDERRVHKGSFVMLHEASGMTWGTAEDHEKQANLLRKINGEIADIYAARSGSDREKCLALMAENDHWMTAEEAVSEGFADAVIAAKAKSLPQKSKQNAKALAGMRNGLRNAPTAALALFGEIGSEAEENDEETPQPRAARSPNGEHNARPSPHVGAVYAELARGRGKRRYGV